MPHIILLFADNVILLNGLHHEYVNKIILPKLSNGNIRLTLHFKMQSKLFPSIEFTR